MKMLLVLIYRNGVSRVEWLARANVLRSDGGVLNR